MTEATKALVRSRAGMCCEYCCLHQDDSPLAALHIEHIRPRKHGGSDEVDNLCLACIDCNLHKGSNLHFGQDSRWPDNHPSLEHELGRPAGSSRC